MATAPAAVVALVALVALAAPAAAQSPNSAAADLWTHDVTFEVGAVTQAELAQLDVVTARLQEPGAYFKVVVLAEPVADYPTTRAYASDVQRAPGGQGRVLAFSPRDVGIASTLDTSAEILSAEQDAIGVTPTGSTASSGSSQSGGGGSGVAILIFLLAIGAVGLDGLRWMRRSRRKAVQKAMAAEASEGD